MVLLIRFWYLPVIALLIIALAVAGLYAKNQRLIAQNARRDLGIAVQVNKDNQEKFTELQRDWAAEKAVTEKELARAQKRTLAVQKILKELENAPDAQKPAGPFLDELSRRLQSPGGEE